MKQGDPRLFGAQKGSFDSALWRNVFNHSPCHTSPRATLKMYVKSAFPTPSNSNNHLIINSNNVDLDFYIHSTASIKVTSKLVWWFLMVFKI